VVLFLLPPFTLQDCITIWQFAGVACDAFAVLLVTFAIGQTTTMLWRRHAAISIESAALQIGKRARRALVLIVLILGLNWIAAHHSVIREFFSVRVAR
jgi:hypothetical protein